MIGRSCKHLTRMARRYGNFWDVLRIQNAEDCESVVWPEGHAPQGQENLAQALAWVCQYSGAGPEGAAEMNMLIGPNNADNVLF
jgi:hypothetical protein